MNATTTWQADQERQPEDAIDKNLSVQDRCLCFIMLALTSAATVLFAAFVARISMYNRRRF
jgi:hypothetical protein